MGENIPPRPTFSQPKPTSIVTIKSGENSTFTIEYGVSVRTVFDVSKLYIVGLLRDKSMSMIATFSRDTENPFPLIQEWLEENFNPGPSAAAKSNTASIQFFIGKPMSEESKPLSTSYVAMIDNITTFRLHSYGILDSEHPRNAQDKAEMRLNTSPDHPLIIGNVSHKLAELPSR